MNQTANQTTFDLIEKLLNASAVNNRAGRNADPFGSADMLFDAESQGLLNDLENMKSYSGYQRSVLKQITRNLMRGRSYGWRTIFDDFRALANVAKPSIKILQWMFNTAAKNVRLTFDTLAVSVPFLHLLHLHPSLI